MTDKTQPRVVVDLCQDWRFLRRRVGRRWVRAAGGDEGAPVDLPHCWNQQDDFQEGVVYYRGPGAYRKIFRLPADAPRAGRLWTLESEGFYGTGDVWLNGQRLGRVDGQYLGFELPASRPLRLDGDNLLGIRLTNRCRAHVLPGIKDPDFLLYGGLAGRLRLVGRPELCFTGDAQVCGEGVLGPAPTAVVRGTVANDSARERIFSVRWTIAAAPRGAVDAEALVELRLAPGARGRVGPLRLAVPGAHRWSPASPRLYQVRGVIEEAGVLVDAAEVRFGFRAAEFRPHQGFFLNGERLELRGCNRHENMPGFGNALPDTLHREDARLIKSLGFNFVRLSHYPEAPVFLDACDELGLLVHAELASWKSVRTGRWLTNACRQLNALIVRDRHHPAIILWGLGNESRSRRAYVRLRAAARTLDPERPVIYAENHFYRAARKKTVGLTDVWGCNYELDALEQGRDAARLGCVVVTECSNYPLARRGDLRAEAEQVALLERDLARLQDQPYVAGFALWCLADYGTLRKLRYARHCGVVDAWRLPKMAVALLRARYGSAPFVKIFGDWGLAGGGRPRDIHIFSNGARTTLTLNGREIAASAGGGHQTLQIPFEPADLCVTMERNG
ncbi:MAG: hypothetical protein NTV49_14740 [Kiritimatiellaeota bacterium]|nr:hypothetical protein [Kiritimatiellota bacterium]